MALLRTAFVLTSTLLLGQFFLFQGQAAKDPNNDATAEHKPQYGKDLRIGGGRAEFILQDAKGIELEAGQLEWCRLLRKVGRFTEEEACRFDGSRVVCDGLPGRGLVGGSYELRLGLGGYGTLVRSFELTPGQQLSQKVQTEAWRRIICLNLTDADKNPLPWIPFQPRYSPKEQAKPAPAAVAPARVLRDPPGTEPEGSGGFAYRRARGGSQSIRFNTDSGKYYLRVFAGVAGTVHVTLDSKLFEDEKLEFEGTFVEPSWDNHAVSIATTKGYLGVASKRPVQNEADPGFKSLLTAAVNLLPNPNDEKSIPKDHWRLVMKPDVALALEPSVTIKRGDETVLSPFQLKLAHAGADRWLDVADDCTAVVAWISPHVISHPASSQEVKRDKRIVTIKPALTLVPLEIEWPSETAKALGSVVHVSLGYAGNSLAGAPRSPDAPIKVHVDKNALNSLSDEDKISATLSASSVHILGDCCIYGSAALSTDLRKQLASGKARVKLKWSGVLWRAVDAQGRAVPWVEATLLRADDAATAIKLRKRWQNVRKGRVTKNVDYKPDYASEMAEVRKITLEKAALDLLERTGAWYDTEAKCQAVGCGFISWACELEAGKKYVLFLWSNSRDELMPDKRIDFTATQGLMDLGAIVLPAHKN